MKAFPPQNIRNVGIIAHSGAGKTTLAEAILYDAGAINRRGTVEKGTSVMDHDPEEVRQQHSLSSAIASCEWKNNKINIIDTPGDQNFVSDTLLSMGVMDAALVLVSAISGVKAQTEKVWEWACQHRLPRVIFINKMDNDKASFEQAFGQIDAHFHQKTLKLTLPIGQGATFQGVVDLLSMHAYIYKKDGEGTFETAAIPDNLLKWAEKERREMVESIAETDEELLEKYMENDTLADADLFAGLRRSVINGSVVPVVCGSASQNIVIRKTLDTIIRFFPSPLDVPARIGSDVGGKEGSVAPDPQGPCVVQIFKTLADPFAGKLSLFRVFSGALSGESLLYNLNSNGAKERINALFSINGKKHEPVSIVSFGDIAAVAKLKTARTGHTLSEKKESVVLAHETPPPPMISVAVEPENKAEDEKLGTLLSRIVEEDPTCHHRIDRETGEMILSGMGQLHLETVVNRLKNRFGLNVRIHSPRIAYRETIRKSATGAGKVKKQSGGHGQFALCSLHLEPLPEGESFCFVNAIVGGVVPRHYIPGVEKGVIETMKKGAQAGYPVTGCKVTLVDGKYHDVDSSEMAFKTAAALAFREAFLAADPVMLEPMMEMEIVVPEESVGDVMADLSQKRGRILGMGIMGGEQRIKAVAPLAEVVAYVKDLRALTGGRGTFTMTFSSYAEAPEPVAKKIREEASVGQT